jgi:hypothetical protein
MAGRTVSVESLLPLQGDRRQLADDDPRLAVARRSLPDRTVHRIDASDEYKSKADRKPPA